MQIVSDYNSNTVLMVNQADGLHLEILNVYRNQEGHELVSDGIDQCAEHLHKT